MDHEDVQDAGFDVVLRGYDKRQVDERMRFLISKLTAAENTLQEAIQRSAVLEEALGQLRSAPG
ncbi:MAG: DivIVA domain-containing protein, partial [Pseudonocardiaceae bacterium]